MKTIMYCHGRGSTGRGRKATVIKEHFCHHRFVGNDYPTDDPEQSLSNKPMPCALHEMKDFWRYVQILTGDIKFYQPDVIVASSFGGPLNESDFGRWLEWSSSFLLKQELSLRWLKPSQGHRAVFIHGRQDDVVVEGSEMLVISSVDATFVEVKDGHRLKTEHSKQAYLNALSTCKTDVEKIRYVALRMVVVLCPHLLKLVRMRLTDFLNHWIYQEVSLLQGV